MPHAEETGLRHGAFDLGDGRTRFSVWAPRADRVELVLTERITGTLGREHDGYHVGVFDAPPGTAYRYRLDGRGPFADPASRSQPEGVHGPSEVVSAALAEPVAGWRGVPLAAQVVCEVHVGAFSADGTFDGVSDALGDLAAAGYTAVELMPVAAFPGERNWGYDGVFPFAVHAGYGGRDGLRRLCAEAHRLGLAILLDVVYNHFGPDGCILEEFGPYLTDRYRTPWGKAVNVDGEGSDEVRRFFVEQAISALREVGVDGFRLDAVHEIADQTATPFLAEWTAAVHAEGRRAGRVVTVVAESSANDPRLVAPAVAGGIGMDGVWNDDFHHALRVALTGEKDRYFGDYRGAGDLATALTAGFVVAGRTAPSRARRHGARLGQALAGERLTVFAQNHDQIGNGGLGRRLAATLALEAQFPVAATVLCAGFVPLRFMGEEYGEVAPFHYFTDHGDPALARAVREGRRAEIGAYGHEVPPDPQDPATLVSCRLDRGLAARGTHRELLEWQRLLLRVRAEEPALGTLEPERSSCWFDETTQSLALVRRADPAIGARPVAVVLTLCDAAVVVEPPPLAGCRLDVLADRSVDALGPDRRITPDPDGRLLVALGAYGVLIAGVVEPAPGHPFAAEGVRFGPSAPVPR
jgi:maltooligosyltrehalose trehalohydrolase